MPNLRDTISRLSADFATALLEAIRHASLAEVSELTGGVNSAGHAMDSEAPATTRRRRSIDDIHALAEKIGQLLHAHSSGLRAEQIRQALHVQRSDLPRALVAALDSGLIRKRGEKRATTYFSASLHDDAKKRGRTSKREGKGDDTKRSHHDHAGSAGSQESS
jgi:hypothetical protein